MGIGEIRFWDCITVRDLEAMTAFLTALGFTEHAAYRDEADPSLVAHAEWVSPDGHGGLMFGSEREDAVGSSRVGTAGIYLVVDDPDAVFEAALAAGGTVVQPMQDQGYGGRGGTVADPDGNQWSFGDYQPH
ncbi:VOC family protein [Nocardioides sp. AE5]|uniref:VOC family protein n=1 Tax=Nocardioides sp. AE5 TaxID=2962573 RepID=UPI0028822548|nr:VOC family protein [Nocardioides sp. AE5]MDT0201560.1 VOC family protein [Nocardioides sp. AE5]